ncbi:MAG: dihydrolipoyl dehydrogenase [Candidatus Aminicenantes bacterium]|nr:dihydrolipoyl dehydrogenase [Candidatus Aminicenantes bacterium]
MKDYDVIVIGSGAGSSIVDQSLAHNMKVALVDKGPLGGTCLNVGCIPSKMLIFPADRIVEIQEASKLGIKAEIKEIDFHWVMERTREYVEGSRRQIQKGVSSVPGLDYYEDAGQFIEDYTMEVSGEKIKGKKIYIVSGARPLIPPVKGIEEMDYLTNETIFELTKKPESLIVVGGGYIAVEFAHFFSAMGTKVTIIQRGERLVKEEEPEVSELLKKKLEKRMDIYTSTEALEAVKTEDGCQIVAKNMESGELIEVQAEKVLVAAGRTSNADLLKPENTGVATNDKGYVEVNDYFETSKKNIWAFGDAIGRKMFRHAANRQADIVWHNSMHGGQEKLDFRTIPHAVFTYPPIASVGMREAEAKKLHDILVGKSVYSEVAKGVAMREDDSFAKAIIEKDTWRILGFHIIGPYAPILIQEVVDAMATTGTVMPIVSGMHVHPALPEVIIDTLRNLKEPG